jgi:phosphinothricin acetyltransferase
MVVRTADLAKNTTMTTSTATTAPVIRFTERGDIARILAISNWAAANTAANFAVEPETLESWQAEWDYGHRMFPWLVAVDRAGTVAGFAKASPWKGRCAYHWTAETSIYVDHQRHGQGIGTALYQRLIETLRAQGYQTLLAGITVPNPASIALHEHFGFRRVAMLERVGWKFGRWHDVGYWELRLQEADAPPPAIRAVQEL